MLSKLEVETTKLKNASAFTLLIPSTLPTQCLPSKQVAAPTGLQKEATVNQLP